MLKATYKLSAGGWSVDSAADPRTELLELDVLHAMNSPAGHCRITAYARAATGGALQSLAAAATAIASPGGAPAGPSSQIRGRAVKAADRLKVELASGSLSATVATAGVQSLETSLELVTVIGRSGMQRLAETRVNQVYENHSLGQIVRDLARQAGVSAGDVAGGSRYPYLVAHESRSVLRVVLELARREGMDVYFDPDDKLVVKAFAKTRPDHVLRYAIDVLGLAARRDDPVATRVLVHGESPASQTGSDTWHWLVDDLGPYRGASGSGARMRSVQDGAVRTKAAADLAAAARLAAIRSRATFGRLVVLGRPTLRLGDAVRIDGVPGAALEGLLKVGSVRHVFNPEEGYVTIVGLAAPAATRAGGIAGAVGALAS